MNLQKFLPSPQFLFYAVIGMSGVALDYAIYFVLLKWCGMNYLLASVISTSAGITNNFIWNCLLNFRTRDRLLARFATFYGVGLLGLAVASAMLSLQVELLHIPPLVAKLSTMVVVLLLQYNLNKRYSFSKSTTHDRNSGISR
jgi:putative flippase GtrA